MRFSTIRLLVAIAYTTCSLSAQTAGVPEIQYRSVPDFLNLPADLYFGEVAGVAVNSKGHIFVFSRGNTTGPAYAAAAAQLLEFGADGKFLREIGHNLYAWSHAHSVRIDPQDNIWITDKGSDVVVKFTPEGRVSMVLGRKQEASDDGTGPLKHVHLTDLHLQRTASRGEQTTCNSSRRRPTCAAIQQQHTTNNCALVHPT